MTGIENNARQFAPFTGDGVCDVCNAPLGGRNAYIVPNDVFYSSPKYREHYRQLMRRLTGQPIPDSMFVQMHAEDRSPGSAVCENCLHMFETPVPAHPPVSNIPPTPPATPASPASPATPATPTPPPATPAAFPQMPSAAGSIPQSPASPGNNGQNQKNTAAPHRKKKVALIVAIVVAAVAVIFMIPVTILTLLTRRPAVDTAQLLGNGFVYLDDGQYHEALEQFRSVIDADPETSEAPYIGAADAYLGLERPDRAVRILEKGYRNTGSGSIQRKLDELAETFTAAEPASNYGNTNGNITNGALAAVQGEWVFYINEDVIYKAKADGSEETYLADEAYGVNVVGDWIYFLKNDNMYKIKTDGSEETRISEDFVPYTFAVAGDWIYYGTVQPYEGYENREETEDISMALGEYGIYKIRTDGSERTQLTPFICHGLNIDGDILYYLDIDNRIWQIRTDGSDERQLLDEYCEYLNVSGDWIYYVNYYDGGIYRMQKDGTNSEYITDGDILNVTEDWLYYSNYDFSEDYSSDIGLYKIRPDGSENTQLINDRVFSPSIVGEWIYYLSMDEDYWLYYNKIRTDGTGWQVLN